jgi:hypothetical protein
MGKQGLSVSLKLCRNFLAAALVLGTFLAPCLNAHAADLPLATSSPLSGLAFDDKPLMLPMQHNFQMAMLTAGSEIGRSCGKMESYGWRMSQSEQGRVDQIFNSTVDHLHTMGYQVDPQNPVSVSHDITLFTADKADRHFLFMWSAGEVGLVMVLCETSPPIAGMANAAAQAYPKDVMQSGMVSPDSKEYADAAAKFTPLGNWVGNYTCTQGYTGGTLQVTSLKGENFQGTFRFYPTDKNPYVPSGRYSVSGQYDKSSQRMLINPGSWIQRPKNYYNTVMIGSFDPFNRTFSAYFQGITGCTSFEAKYVGGAPVEKPTPKKHAAKKKTAAKKTVAKKATVAKGVAEPSQPAPIAKQTPATAPTLAPGIPAPAAAAPTPLPSLPSLSVAPPPGAPPVAPPLEEATPSMPPADVPSMAAPEPSIPSATPPAPSSIVLPSTPPSTDEAPAPQEQPGK